MNDINDSIRLYCESCYYQRKGNRHVYEVTFHFNSEEERDYFPKIIGLNSGDLESSNADGVLLVITEVQFPSCRVLKAGNWYEIPFVFFANMYPVSGKHNNLIALKLIGSKSTSETALPKPVTPNPEELFTLSDLKHYNIAITDFSKSKFLNTIKSLGLKDDTHEECPEFIVRNVGFGNWNEVVDGNFRFLFDIGGTKIVNTPNKLINNIKWDSQFDTFILISHWHLDHYSSLFDLDLNSNDYKGIRSVIAPVKYHGRKSIHNPNIHLPKTMLFENLFHTLNKAKISLELVLPTVNSQSKNSGTQLNKVGAFNSKNLNFDIYRSNDVYRQNDLNRKGFVATVNGPETVVVLTGDHYYTEINRDVMTTINKNKELHFVIPHHGGNANKVGNVVMNHKFHASILSTVNRSFSNFPRKSTKEAFMNSGNVKLFHCTDNHAECNPSGAIKNSCHSCKHCSPHSGTDYKVKLCEKSKVKCPY